jgi:prepilin-type N-terminal cleavage/methylation domain-containing protein
MLLHGIAYATASRQPRRFAQFLRAAFSLIEVLIVVSIVGILAAVVMSQVVISTDDAKSASLKHSLHTLRAQIEMYKLTHNGMVPTLSGGTLPQITSATNAAGDVGLPSRSYPFGPYVAGGRFPENPFDSKNIVSATAQFPPTAATADGGWLYHTATGRIAANTAGHLSD